MSEKELGVARCGNSAERRGQFCKRASAADDPRLPSITLAQRTHHPRGLARLVFRRENMRQGWEVLLREEMERARRGVAGGCVRGAAAGARGRGRGRRDTSAGALQWDAAQKSGDGKRAERNS